MNGYPRLYIGRAAQELKMKCPFPINQVYKDTLSEFISYYTTVHTMAFPLVIEDIAILNQEQQSELLKFVEDSPLKIILLSSEDCVISTILSRMSLVYKHPDKVKSLFDSPIHAQEELSKLDTDTLQQTYIRKQMEISPLAYYYDQLLENKSNKQKLLRLLG